ncbi:MAG: NTP transferase domain-containing protein [Mariprofundaceae bacterium]|nr:NTP transferase domain-containing protein [Mariprofundaceae bacterium]
MVQLERAVILAAGLGTRLKWMTSHRPKALINIQGEPSIVHVIRQLAGQGIHQIAVNTHHHAGILMDFLGNGEKWGVNLVFSQENELLNSGGGVCTALSHLPGKGAVLVHNADVLADVDVQSLAGLCPESGCALALVKNPKHHLQGDFALNHGMVCMYGEPRYTFSGVSVWHADAFCSYAVNTNFSLLQTIEKMLDKQCCAGMMYCGQWFDIGRPKDVMRANRLWNGRG